MVRLDGGGLSLRIRYSDTYGSVGYTARPAFGIGNLFSPNTEGGFIWND